MKVFKVIWLVIVIIFFIAFIYFAIYVADGSVENFIEFRQTHEFKCTKSETRCYQVYDSIAFETKVQVDCDRNYDRKLDYCLLSKWVNKTR